MTFQQTVVEGTGLLLDGGMGSELLARGLPRGTPPERWDLDRGDAITEVHRAYVDAGSIAIHTNTFGGNPIRLAKFGLADRCEEINRRAVDLARAAGPRFVIGDLGPTGEYRPPVGRGTPSLWREAFRRQASALLEAEVDALHVETMSDATEAREALDALLHVADGIPIMISMTFESRPRGFFTIMGDPLVSSLESLAADGAFAVGANCSITSVAMRALVDEASEAISLPLVAQPNAGTPEIASDGIARYGQTPDEFADDMAAIAARGTSLVGGCCGTDSRFIAALRTRLGDPKR